MSENAIAIIERKDAARYFVDKGLDPIIEKIRDEVSGIVTDISTEKGRKDIASLAYKVAKSKTTLDNMGKELVSGIKEQAKAIDAERKRAWDALEAIQKEVRAPLTDWENRDKERVAAHEAALAAIPESPHYGQTETASEIAVRLAHLENLPHRDWQEFSARYSMTIAMEIERTKSLLVVAQQREAEAAELARLRKEEADRQQREREERLKAEAAETARVEAESKARADAEAEAARVRAEREWAEQERQRIQREKDESVRLAADAEARAKKAEEDRKATEEKAAVDARAAADQAKRDAEAAAQAERDKIEEERKAEADALAAREADKAHRAKINNEAMAAILKAGAIADAEERARAIIIAIAKGLIPHVKISY